LSGWIIAAQDCGAVIVAKRLSANDSGATGAHQVGLYFTRSVVDQLFPEMHLLRDIENPKLEIQSSFSSHNVLTQEVTLTWYNNRNRGGTRNEFRLTGWGGKASPIQDTESTGSLVLFAFSQDSRQQHICDLWLCRDVDEEEIVDAALGVVEPGEMAVLFSPNGLKGTTSLVEHDFEKPLLPASWNGQFPMGQDLVTESVRLVPEHGVGIDRLLIMRREVEFELFRQLENSIASPRIQEGFKTLDEFIQFAGSLTNRRKSRSGKSLELQVKELLERQGVHFNYDSRIEGGKRPDFLFPSVSEYEDPSTSPVKLAMLAVKTTCKDRWRQILNEASRIPTKHLLTLQEGVSEGQFAEMSESQVVLVVPEPLHSKYPKSVRSQLLTVEDFVNHIQVLESKT
jgi:hypothetical protein